MRPVAIHAVFRRGIVSPLGRQLLFDVLVTAKAEFRALCDQKRIDHSLVGVVAARAFAIGDRSVAAHRLRHVLFDVVVTFHADQSLIIDENTRVHAGMWGVAGEAFAAPERIVQDRTTLFSHQLVVALATKIRIYRLEKAVLVRTVALVASDTVSEPNGGMHVGLRKLAFEVVVAGITELVGPIDEDARNVGTVGIVALRRGRAAPPACSPPVPSPRGTRNTGRYRWRREGTRWRRHGVNGRTGSRRRRRSVRA